jgi:sugar lactone lactonase YvrE
MDRNVTRIGMAALLATGLAVTAGCSRGDAPVEPAADAAAAASPPAEISIPGTRVFPESITSRSDGTLYIGSVGQSLIFRVPPGQATAEVFIQPGTGGARQIFGVFADEASGTLWACSNELGGGAPGASPPGPSALHAFDLDTGAARASYAFPQGGMCNDIAVGPGGDVYATDTQGMQVLRLPKGGSALEVWSPQGAFGAPGDVLDGIAVVNGRVIVNTLRTNKLFAIDVAADGKAAKVTELTLSSPVTGPDGMRAWGSNGLLTTDGTGKIQHVVIDGDNATVTTVKDGLEGPVSVAVAGGMGYALEGQLAIMFAPPGQGPEEKPYRAVGFPLP